MEPAHSSGRLAVVARSGDAVLLAPLDRLSGNGDLDLQVTVGRGAYTTNRSPQTSRKRPSTGCTRID